MLKRIFFETKSFSTFLSPLSLYLNKLTKTELILLISDINSSLTNINIKIKTSNRTKIILINDLLLHFDKNGISQELKDKILNNCLTDNLKNNIFSSMKLIDDKYWIIQYMVMLKRKNK